MNQDHWLLGFLLVVAVASGTDLVSDISHGVALLHVLQEAVVMAVAVLGFAWIALRLHGARRLVSALKAELLEVQKQPQPNSQALLLARKQLAESIKDQFDQWVLTASEKEVGMLLLKGFSLKEIAALRGTAEKTIRHQASAIYKKAGVVGRHGFSAWFIEDFL